MPITSLSILRHRAAASVLQLRRHFSAPPCAARHQNPGRVSTRHQKQQPDKNLLRAKQLIVKEYSSLAPILSPDDAPALSESEAIGMVAAAQANFMRVVVQATPAEMPAPGSSERSGESAGVGVGVELLCVVKAVLKKIKRRVLVGDTVLVRSIDWVDRRGWIENVFERKTEIADPPVANVDQLLLLFSMEQPKVDPFVLTRFLIEAESTGIPLTLALNKAELADEESLITWKSRLRSWGYEPIFCSVESKLGLEELAFSLRNQTTVIVGPSGVGKSSLINALRNNYHPRDATVGDNWFEPIIGSKWLEEQRVGEVSARSGRGKHTTRHVSLLPIAGGGYLADTPGFNQPSLLKVTKQSLAETFPEFRKRLQASDSTKCAFSNCLHIGERGCVLDGDTFERYSYYFQLLDEIRVREEFQLRTFGTKKETDVRYKVGEMGVKQAEPRLEMKKHRRKSRKTINQSIMDGLEELDDDEDTLDDEEDPVLRALRNETE